MSTSPRLLKPKPQLDGIRGLAIGAVLWTHLGFLGDGAHRWELSGGFLGVDLFVVLSAFLIALVILSELDRRPKVNPPDLNVSGFARRRARRVYPVLIVFLVIEGLIAVATGTEVGVQLTQSAFALTFLSNWELTLGIQPPFELVHIWSLALEVQFYALLAAGFFWWGRGERSLKRVMVGLLIATMLVTAWRLLLHEAGVLPAELYERTDTRADLLFLGVAAAFVWRSEMIPDRWIRKLGLVGGLFLLTLFVFADPSSPWLFDGGFTLVALAAGAVVAAATTGKGLVCAVGNWRPLRWLGAISFSLYLWHLPIYIWVNRALTEQTAAVRIAVAVPAAVLAGWISYRLVESRFLAGWRKGPDPSGQSDAQTGSPEADTRR